MANACFIYFEEAPKEADVRSVALNFLGPEIGTLNTEHSREGSFFVDIRGVPSFPFKGLPGAREHHFPYDHRWIEFDFIKEGKILIIQTRQTDEFTSSLSRSIGMCIARYFNGKFDSGG